MEDIIDKIVDFIISWGISHGPRIIGILVFGWIIHKVSHRVVEGTVRKLVTCEEGSSKEAEEKRENTLIRIFHMTVATVLWVIMGMLVLSEFGLDIAPLLAAAGLVGVAVGFGAQYLIRDVITGFFLIMENQFRIGDVVCLDDTCGSVEDITLRLAVLRDLDGAVHHIPHGSVSKVSNLSKKMARVNLDIGVSYDADIEKVEEVVNRVGVELAADPKFSEMITKPPQFLRINNFGDSSVDIKILGDTQPLKQWEVTGELRKRIKIAFDKEGIEIPFPQRVMHQAKK
ncbi:MAG: mechanosensitive ion channel family protein [bacterium]|nr:mechanosensitive ion channel family protein [bacterium]